MKIRSRGLGKREINMDLHEFKLERDGDEVVLSGVTHAPVAWETSVRIAAEDIGGILRMAASPKVLRLGVRWALHMKTQPRELPPPEWQRRTGPVSLRAHLASKGEEADDSMSGSGDGYVAGKSDGDVSSDPGEPIRQSG